MNRPFTLILTSLSLVALAAPVALGDSTERVVQKISWQAEQKAGRLLAGEVRVAPGQEPAEWLVISHADGPKLFPLLEIAHPGVNPPGYLVRGKIRYEGVQGDGFVEMWSHLPDGSAYFTRTLGEMGPMAKLTGTSTWRDMALPFSLQIDEKTSAPGPNKLVLNLFLPGPGKVELGPWELIQLPAGAKSAAWWPDSTGGWIGGILGSLIGFLGATIAIGSKLGLSRNLSLSLAGVAIGLGALLLVTGFIALLLGQPYAVYYPLLLVGLLGVVILCIMVPTILARARQRELRRMQALDIA